MALFNPMLGDIRGKIAGLVFSRNRGGAYLRSKVTPVNPNTGPQSAVRSMLSAQASSYRALTPADQQDWKTYGESVQQLNVFGNTYSLSAIQAMVRTNVSRARVILPAITTAPSTPGQPEGLQFAAQPSSLPITLSAAANSLELSDLTADAIFQSNGWLAATDDAVLYVYVTPKGTPTDQYFQKVPGTLVGAVVGDSVTPPPDATFTLPFGVFEGLFYTLSFRWQDAQGRMSPFLSIPWEAAA